MSQLTKKAIMDCTLELAQTRPVGKITVRDIVETCGITRNTFYYYYHDIFDVIDDLINQKLEEFEKRFTDDFEEALFEFLGFCADYKKVWVNLYKTIGYDEMSKYAMKHLRGVIRDVITHEAGDLKLSPTDEDIVFAFYEEAIIGVAIRWMKNDRLQTPDDIRFTMKRIQKLFRGHIQLVIENSRKE